MKIAIAGYSGFIGSHLSDFLSHHGHSIVKISRLDLERSNNLKAKLNSIDAVINLCGSPIYGSWSESGKKRIIDSRILTTRAFNTVIEELEIKPKIFINASAVGIYDNDNVVQMWESEFYNFNIDVVRKVSIRMGIVIDKRGGFFKKIYQFRHYGFLPVISNDEAAFPLIVLNDLLKIFEFSLVNDKVKGPVNAVLPMPITSGDFYYKIRSYSPFVFIFRLKPKYLVPFLGERILRLTENPIVFPRKLLELGFKFDIPDIDCYLKKLRG